MPPNPAIPSPRQGECKPGSLLERDPVAYFKLKHRNIDKQRRRLLAAKLERNAYHVTERARPMRTGFSAEVRAKATILDDRAEKLRTIAARLRGTE